MYVKERTIYHCAHFKVQNASENCVAQKKICRRPGIEPGSTTPAVVEDAPKPSAAVSVISSTVVNSLFASGNDLHKEKQPEAGIEPTTTTTKAVNATIKLQLR